MKYIYTFGSNRHSRNFSAKSDDPLIQVIHICEEKDDEENVSKSPETIKLEFEKHYKLGDQILAFLMFGRATVLNGIENLSSAWDLILDSHPELRGVQLIGPIGDSAKIFFNKDLTQIALSKLGITTPKTVNITAHDVQKSLAAAKKLQFPIVVKALDLSGGRGMKYVGSLDVLESVLVEMETMGIEKLIATEFIQGEEVTLTMLRLGNNFLRLPASIKPATDSNLTHPDNKVKLAGIFKNFETEYLKLQKIMQTFNIFGFFCLQGIITEKGHIYYIEGATRMTGGSPIVIGSLKGLDIHRLLLDWIVNKNIRFGFENRLAIQYVSYKHKKEETVEKLLQQDWVLDAKYEDLSAVPFSNDSNDRIRISFFIEPKSELEGRLSELERIIKNSQYKYDILKFINMLEDEDKLLTSDKKILEGVWNDNTSWEFYLSDNLPARELCTAVFCLGIYQNQVVLTRTNRGWELLGGHIEPGETVEQTLEREAQEEGGMKVQRYKLFGYRKVTSKVPVHKEQGEGFYPFPVSYIPHYLGITDEKPEKFTGKEVIDNGLFLIDNLDTVRTSHLGIIYAGLEQLQYLE